MKCDGMVCNGMEHDGMKIVQLGYSTSQPTLSVARKFQNASKYATQRSKEIPSKTRNTHSCCRGLMERSTSSSRQRWIIFLAESRTTRCSTFVTKWLFNPTSSGFVADEGFISLPCLNLRQVRALTTQFSLFFICAQSTSFSNFGKTYPCCF